MTENMNKNESQSKENQGEQTTQLADLEPSKEVKGGDVTLSGAGAGNFTLTFNGRTTAGTTVNNGVALQNKFQGLLDQADL